MTKSSSNKERDSIISEYIDKTKDININAAISGKEEIKTLYFIDELNTQNTLESNHLLFQVELYQLIN